MAPSAAETPEEQQAAFCPGFRKVRIAYQHFKGWKKRGGSRESAALLKETTQRGEFITPEISGGLSGDLDA